MQIRVIAMLGLAVMLSAVAVIYVRHQNRLAFMATQVQQKYRDELDIEWRQLMLERATWGTEHTVAAEARKKLKMQSPPPAEIVTLKFFGEGFSGEGFAGEVN
ncbi:MAG: cell division protein FtsL [Pseudomonadota bacterium]|nr:cell division protein FtsL [Pseudomonadota bacterium]